MWLVYRSRGILAGTFFFRNHELTRKNTKFFYKKIREIREICG